LAATGGLSFYNGRRALQSAPAMANQTKKVPFDPRNSFFSWSPISPMNSRLNHMLKIFLIGGVDLCRDL
jgi:hypothetical protein